MNMKDEKFAAQLIAELLDANTAAFGVLTAALADVVGREALQNALSTRLTIAQAAQRHPIRDRLLEQAMKSLQAKH